MTEIRQFNGEVAFITGAGAGIGRAIAINWGDRGRYAIVTDQKEQAAQEVAKFISKAGGRALPMHLDVGDSDAIHRTVAATVDSAGGIDALFNVAGVNIHRNVEEMEEEEWDQVFDINLKSIYRISKRVIPLMREREGGSI